MWNPPIQSSCHHSGAPYVSVAVSGTLALAGSDIGWVIVDVSDPTQPVRLGGGSGRAWGFALSGNLLYVAGMGGWPQPAGLSIYDVSNPGSPVPLGYCPPYWDDGNSVVLYDHYAYVVGEGGNNQLRVCDVADPANPVLVASYAANGGQAWRSGHTCVTDPQSWRSSTSGLNQPAAAGAPSYSLPPSRSSGLVMRDGWIHAVAAAPVSCPSPLPTGAGLGPEPAEGLDGR
jgi:hypothetical protein